MQKSYTFVCRNCDGCFIKPESGVSFNENGIAEVVCPICGELDVFVLPVEDMEITTCCGQDGCKIDFEAIDRKLRK